MKTFIYLALQESENEVWMMLSKWGILHLMRTGIIGSITEALDRGVEIKIVAEIESKTVRFYEELDKRIEIRHHQNQS